ncbi:MAG: protein kinase [Gemmatimonadales bacterium]
MTEPTERLSSALADRYKILSRLGEGGMATVYLAEDLKHKRQVAVKVLRPELAAVLGAERFVQEITTTANLQHPHILPLFDSGEADSFLYYVMPYIEGETLRAKLDRETQLGIDEAVKITTDVADALDYAHRHGIIHRDIKPENILMHDGRPMVADFGIALAVSAAAGGRMTETGLSLGTPHYMSPEQATAEKEITARSDVYSLGSVLYEMLAGEPPHMGNSAQQIIMKIIAEDAQAVTELRKSVPPNVAAAVAKSLEKLPADRFPTAAEFGAALTESGFAHRTGAATATSGTVSARPRWLQSVHAAVTVVLVLALAWALGRSSDVPAPMVMRTVLADSLPPLNGLAISPDGSHIAVAIGFQQLYLRRADELEFRPIPGTEGGSLPNFHFSPDGQWLAFVLLGQRADGRLRGGGRGVYRKVPVTGGPAVTIMDSVLVADWGADGSIAVVRQDGLYFLEPGAETPRRVVETAEGMTPSRPSVLPDGSGILFDTERRGRGQVMLWDRRSDSLKFIASGGSDPQYLSTGHVLYLTPDYTAFVIPFDLDRNEPSGAPVPVLKDVWAPIPGFAALAVSRGGTLLFATALSIGENERLAWAGMDGAAVDLPVRVDDFEDPRVSPDGRLIAYDDFAGGRVIVVYDLLSGSTATLPVTGPFAWAHDSESLFVSGPYGLVRVPADGGGPIDTLSLVSMDPYSASADGSWLVAGVHEGTSMDLVMIPLEGTDHDPVPYLHADWDEYQGVISPDGRWLAYISQETGESEVYIRSFPELGRRMQASVEGGVGPVWAPDGSALYFVSGGALVRGDFRPGANPGVIARTDLFSVDGYEVSAGAFMENNHARRRYDIHPDGTTFLMTRSLEETFSLRQPVIVVTNWFEELREKMGE